MGCFYGEKKVSNLQSSKESIFKEQNTQKIIEKSNLFKVFKEPEVEEISFFERLNQFSFFERFRQKLLSFDIPHDDYINKYQNSIEETLPNSEEEIILQLFVSDVDALLKTR